MDECTLKRAGGIDGVPCDEDACPFWRLADHVREGGDPHEGCAMEYYSLLDGGDSVAEWLLSVKERIEALESGGGGDRSEPGDEC